MRINELEWMADMRVLDRTREPAAADVAEAFALDEWLGRAVGGGEPPICHLWRHPRAFVIGSKDSRLPHAAEAAHMLERAGYSVLVRSSGGAAVPLDLGVVNASLILPITASGTQDFRADFERMYVLIRRATSLYGRGIERGEVPGSYCPGDYDLSLDGLKFCGIAQRRQLRAMIVQAFVVVEGSGAARARLVRNFYEVAGAGAQSGAYPDVRPETMTSLEERALAGLDSAEAFADSLASIVRNAAEDGGRPSPVILPDAQAIADMGQELRTRYMMSENKF
ncbi:lipoate--protein ligase family protein [Cohnella cellulosilytica]|uniref:Biotin/lipoate A/B protein ligase family protein n=1 Tax=Cohnella cellulosilytica TaxID=986710 RepID=A0ABW2F9D1_9BACL